MSKNLVIVESPAKCKKIESYLGPDFRVVASMGHFRDLPQKGLGIDMDTMEGHYTISKQDVVDRLNNLAKNVESVYLCTDPDREGEAISWHLKEVLPQDKKFLRATFQEITKKAVQKAISNPIYLNDNLVNAQKARRILDRLVGYKISPALWTAFKGEKSLSAGRVQSVATRLIVDREREIEAFVQEVYYRVFSHHEKDNKPFRAELKFLKEGAKKKKFKINDLSDVESLILKLKELIYVVDNVKKKEQKLKPQPPFTTSNLQAKAAHLLKFPPAKTMQVAQKLYEGGHITYHRTDSTTISEEALTNLKEWIKNNYGEEYLPPRAHKFDNKAGSQEAHECIRPTAVDKDQPLGLSNDELNLYRLIRKQFISCQMSFGVDAVTNVTIKADEYLFEAKGRIELFDGFRKLNRTEVQEKSDKKKQEESDEKQVLPNLEKGETLNLKKVEKKEQKTKPPQRYTEASLIKKLEKEGIGRPSTYASIVATIEKRGYVKLLKRSYHAQDLGMRVNDYLVHKFPRVLDLGFTRTCEDRLDSISTGDLQHNEFLKKFWIYLREQLSLQNSYKPMPKKQDSPKCPKCQKVTKLEESPKWKGRFFYCCHSCKCYLEKTNKPSNSKLEWKCGK